ncbi:flagellar export protein FliJ [Aneurinibacillus sp. BA2021]|nr:flagellar export protein FliJ [Aneurinibacillus sp. BA2021]
MKEKEKEQAEISYSKSMQVLRQEQERLAHLERNKQQMEQQMLQKEKNISLAELKTNYEYIGHLQRLIAEANESKQRAEKEVENRQFILSERTMDQKIWEKLKENSFEKYKDAMRLLEQKELDEIAVGRYYRQQADPR